MAENASTINWDKSVDILVVGSGNGALTTALCSHEMGVKDVLVIEKEDQFGGHSHNHNILGHLSKQQYTKEINNSLNFLKKRGLLEIRHYSYPEGFKTSFNNEIINLLKKNKIKTGVTTLIKKQKRKSLFKLNRSFVI